MCKGFKMVYQKAKAVVEETTKQKVGLVIVYGELFGGVYPHPDVPDLGLL
jgi:hypothetical protein